MTVNQGQKVRYAMDILARKLINHNRVVNLSNNAFPLAKHI